jgi:hypothetical protein
VLPLAPFAKGVGERHASILCHKTVSCFFLAASTTLPNSMKPAYLMAKRSAASSLKCLCAAVRETPCWFADLAQCQRVNPFPLNQFKATFDQSGA